jgi:hypothetical protein
MCCAELLTWQWDSEVSRRFHGFVIVRDTGEFVTFKADRISWAKESAETWHQTD